MIHVESGMRVSISFIICVRVTLIIIIFVRYSVISVRTEEQRLLTLWGCGQE